MRYDRDFYPPIELTLRGCFVRPSVSKASPHLGGVGRRTDLRLGRSGARFLGHVHSGNCGDMVEAFGLTKHPPTVSSIKR